jgi:hypothetical protein
MAMRVVGGGERFVATKVVSLSGETGASVRVPAGADLARIQPQLVTNGTDVVLFARGGTLDAPTVPTLAANELALNDREVVTEPYPAGEIISFALFTSAGAAATGGTNDRLAIVFYTSAAGRAGVKGAN